MEMIQLLHKSMGELRQSPQPRVTLEVALLSLICQPTATPTAVAAVSASRPAPVARQTPPPRPQAPPPMQPPVAAPPSMQPQAGENLNGAQIWEQTLATLQAANKRMTLACLRQGKFHEMAGQKISVVFPPGIMAEMAMQKYRKSVEAIFTQLTGQKLELFCFAHAPAAQPKPTPPPNPMEEAKDLSKLPPVERDNIQNAMDILGGEPMPVL